MRTWVALVAASLLAVPIVPWVSAEETEEYVVWTGGSTASGLSAAAIIDDYGTFVTARLTTSDAEFLRSEGFSVEILNHTVTRGRFTVGSDLPPGLRATESPYMIVQFRGPVRQQWYEGLQEVADILDYIPRYAFLVRVNSDANEVSQLPGVARTEVLHPAYKLAKELPNDGNVDIAVLVGAHASRADVVETLGPLMEVSEIVRTDRGTVVTGNVEAGALASIASVGSVIWVEPSLAEGAGFDNDQGSALVQNGRVNTWPLHDNGVDGSTQIVSVCDSGVSTTAADNSAPAGHELRWMRHEVHNDTDSSDSRVEFNRHLQASPVSVGPHRKVVLYYAPIENGVVRGDFIGTYHGTHTAGTLAGDKKDNSNQYGTRNHYDGVAYKSKLVICDILVDGSLLFEVLNDYSNYFLPAYNHSANVSSNSWGRAPSNVYTLWASQHDAFTWARKNFTIVRSMGNNGTINMRTEAGAKNVIGVGASESKFKLDECSTTAIVDKVWALSGRGPTEDGRIKPDVVAPGAAILSAWTGGTNLYTLFCGTSMATPMVAGAAALVRDYFAKGFYPSGNATTSDRRNISSALVKAMIVSSGRDIAFDDGETNFPNRAQGWGRIVLENVTYFYGQQRKLLVVDNLTGLSTGGTHSFTLRVTDSHEPLRIMLAWTDYPGSAGANPAIVNDLDLRVNITLPTGQDVVYIGNNFGLASNQTASGIVTHDRINVQEAVYRNSPVPGIYTVRVTGYNVANGPQPFALAITGQVAWT